MGTENLDIVFHTEDPFLQQVVIDYWSHPFRITNEQLKDRLQSAGIEVPNDIRDVIRTLATVCVRDVACRTCGRPRELHTRNDAKMAYSGVIWGCTDCAEAAYANTMKQKADAAAHLRALVQATYADGEEDFGAIYSLIGFADAVLLRALDEWSGGKLTQGDNIPPLRTGGKFMPTDRALSRALRHLTNEQPGLLMPALLPDSLEGFEIDPQDSNKFHYYLHLVHYRLAPSCEMGGWATVDPDLRAVRPKSVERGMEAWLSAAVDMCSGYLELQMDYVNLPRMSDGFWTDCERVFVAAAGSWAPAQVWSVIWRCVRDAAVLANRPYYSLEKATATIPGKIERFLKKVGTDPLPFYDRIPQHEISNFEMVWADAFGFDERTTPAAARQKFAYMLQQDPDDTWGCDHVDIDEMLKAARKIAYPEVEAVLALAVLVQEQIPIGQAAKAVKQAIESQQPLPTPLPF